MPKRKLSFQIGCCYQIYNKAVGEEVLFRNQENFLYFRSRLEKYLDRTAVVLAYCLLPNHYHLLVQLVNDDLSEKMKLVGMSYAKSYNNHFQRTGHLFQGRFQAKPVRTDQYLVHLSGYIHSDPVRSCLVQAAEDWRFSSYPVYLGKISSELVDTRKLLKVFAGTVEGNQGKVIPLYQTYVDQWPRKYSF